MKARKTILLVEDEQGIAWTIMSILRDEGHDVIHAQSGEGAIAAVRTPDTPIDLVLMDINLGAGMDGPEAAERILAERDLPILFLSADTRKEPLDRIERISSYGYVAKNSGGHVLTASIGMALRLYDLQRALRTSEERYVKAFQTSPDAVMINRFEDGVFLAVNTGFCDYTGYAADEAIGRRSDQAGLNLWVNDDDRTTLRAELSARGETTGLETEIRTKSGGIRTALISARTLEFNAELCILTIARDITERKRTEELLRQQDALLRVFFETAEDNIMVNYVGPDGIPSTFVEVNDSTCKVFGYTREEMFRMRPMDITEAGDPAEMIRISQTLMSKGRATYEVFGRTKDGAVIPFEVKARRIASGDRHLIMSISRDITERKRLEESRERRLSLLSGATRGGMDVTFQDLFDVKEIQEIQDAFAEATGVASIITDPAGVPITEPSRFSNLCLNIIRKSEKGRINCQYSDRVLGKMNPGGPIAQPCLSGGLWDGGTSIQLGDVHLANWLVGQVLEEDFDEDKMLAYAREIGVDEQEFKAALKNVTRMPRDQFLRICNALFLIARLLSRLALQNTQQARHIAARERAEEALRGMVKQKETLMQELQHRVKNNLGIISSLLSLEKPRLTDNQAYQVFTNAENRIRAMSRIYEQLYRSDTLTRIDLNTYIADLVQGLVDSYSPDRERIRLSLQVDALPMDLKRVVPLGLILNEVMTNAVKYAYPGDAQGEIRIGMSKADATITLTVSDDGVGLPADFDIKKTESLGLQLVKMLTDQIDGTLTIVGGKGTTIAVSFPS